jgi:hypothetical protein
VPCSTLTCFPSMVNVTVGIVVASILYNGHAG